MCECFLLTVWRNIWYDRLLCGSVDFNGTGAITAHEAKALRVHEQRHSELSFVFISELHLDDPKTLRNFGAMLQGYIDADFIPFAFVLCGTFVSSQRASDAAPASAAKSVIEQYQDAFTALGDLLVRFPTIVRNSHFIFVPSAEDPNTTATLPRKALPKAITDKLTQRLIRGNGGNVSAASKCHFVSNPCRLVYFGQEIVIFRDDVLQRLLAHTVRLKGDRDDPTAVPVGAGAGSTDGQAFVDLKKYLVSTVLDQAHLSPLPAWARPILWEYDHTLRLYPMPSAVSACKDLGGPYVYSVYRLKSPDIFPLLFDFVPALFCSQLVLADKFQRYELTYEGCHVFNPSSFREGNFCWTTYYPASGKAERSELPS